MGDRWRCRGAPFGPSQLWVVHASVPVKHGGHPSSSSLCYWYIAGKCCPTETLTSAGVVIYIYSQCVEGRFAFRHSSPFFASKV